jgi:hypothetical protein
VKPAPTEVVASPVRPTFWALITLLACEPPSLRLLAIACTVQGRFPERVSVTTMSLNVAEPDRTVEVGSSARVPGPPLRE